MIRRLLVATMPILLAGCAEATTSYPSLAPRPAERLGFDEPARPAPAIAPDPTLDAEVAKLTTRLTAVGSGFAAAARNAERRTASARGRPAGSDAWLEAQTALAGLDDWRAQASALATDIGQLAIDRAATLASPYPALTALGDRTETEVNRQTGTIARLQAMLAPA